MSRIRFSQKSQDYHKIVADLPHLRLDSKPGVDTVGIYVENHYNENRELFIWIQFDNLNISEKGSLPALREDAMISETCPLEESASHHEHKSNLQELIKNERSWNELGHVWRLHGVSKNNQGSYLTSRDFILRVLNKSCFIEISRC